VIQVVAGTTTRGRSTAAPLVGPGLIRLSLLNTFELVRDGAAEVVPKSGQRLLALLAVSPRPVQRPYAAGTLWPDTSEARAHGSLRSALWRVQRLCPGLIEPAGARLGLGPTVEVDLHAAEAVARQALDESDADVVVAGHPTLLLTGDLLPDWYDDWVLFERERFRHLRLRALDVLCERLMRAGRLGDAAEVGHAALAAEPLRESAHRALVRIHLAEGNTVEALRQYRLCRRVLRDQLGVEPSELMEELMRAAAVPYAI
jgi:DNA-binding SARP family transcriptional activator